MREAGRRVSRLAKGDPGLLTATPVAGHTGGYVPGAVGGAFDAKAGVWSVHLAASQAHAFRAAGRRGAWGAEVFLRIPGRPAVPPAVPADAKDVTTPVGPVRRSRIPLGTTLTTRGAFFEVRV